MPAWKENIRLKRAARVALLLLVGFVAGALAFWLVAASEAGLDFRDLGAPVGEYVPVVLLGILGLLIVTACAIWAPQPMYIGFASAIVICMAIGFSLNFVVERPPLELTLSYIVGMLDEGSDSLLLWPITVALIVFLIPGMNRPYAVEWRQRLGGKRRNPVTATQLLFEGGEPKWWVRDLVIAFMVSVMVGTLSLLGQKWIDDERAARDARAENLRFVRDLSVSSLLAQTRLADAGVDDQTADGDSERVRVVPLRGLDLQDQNLAGLTLLRADFSGSLLAGVDFTNADLTDADFRSATISSAIIVNATMPGAQFQNSVLDDAVLRDSNFRGADFHSTSARNLNQRSVDVAESSHQPLDNNDFSGARFFGTDLSGSFLQGSNFTDAVFIGMNMRDADLTRAIFTNATLEDVNLSGSDLRGVDFSTTNFIGVQRSVICWDSETRWPENVTPPRGKADGCAR